MSTTSAVIVLLYSSSMSSSVVTVSCATSWPDSKYTAMGASLMVAPDSVTDTITVTSRVVWSPSAPPRGLKSRFSVNTTSSPSVAVWASAAIEISISGPIGVAEVVATAPPPATFKARTSNM